MLDLTSRSFPCPPPAGVGRLSGLDALPPRFYCVVKTPDEARIRAKQHKLFYMPSYEADVGAIRTVGAAGNGFLFALRDLITTRGTDRAIRLSKMRFFLKICQKYKAKIVVASLASSPHELRDSHELIAICGLLGLNPEQAKAAFEQVEVMLKRK